MAKTFWAATLAASIAMASTAHAQQVLVTPQADDASPQTIEDLLGAIAEDDAPPDWAETDVRFRPQPNQGRSFAVLSALDKITATVSPLAIGVGESVAFGTLTITVRSCQTTSSDGGADGGSDGGQNAVFVEIDDQSPGQEVDEVFSGWMFSAARAVSAMDHPVYDLWLASCVDEVPRPPEDMAREVRFGLPDNPPLPAPTPTRRL